MTITGLRQGDACRSGQPRYEATSPASGARTGVEVRVVDDDDRELPAGEIGEIADALRLRDGGLLDQPGSERGRRCAAAGCTPATSAAWTHDGFLTLKDRSKDMIISRRLQHLPARDRGGAAAPPGAWPSARSSARPHPEWGEEVVAFVVAARGARSRAQELDALCLDNIARFKRPQRLPLRRRAAEEQLRQGAEDRAAGTTRAKDLRTSLIPAQAGIHERLSRLGGNNVRTQAEFCLIEPADLEKQ